jgi:hypothetical protein
MAALAGLICTRLSPPGRASTVGDVARRASGAIEEVLDGEIVFDAD